MKLYKATINIPGRLYYTFKYWSNSQKGSVRNDNDMLKEFYRRNRKNKQVEFTNLMFKYLTIEEQEDNNLWEGLEK